VRENMAGSDFLLSGLGALGNTYRFRGGFTALGDREHVLLCVSLASRPLPRRARRASGCVVETLMASRCVPRGSSPWIRSGRPARRGAPGSDAATP
jgi:hypothetical protein